MTVPTADRWLLERVCDAVGPLAGPGTVSWSAVGPRLVAVEVSGSDARDVGVAHGPPGGLELEVPLDAAELSAWSHDPPGDDPVAAALGIAALNARSAGHVEWRAGDPMGSLDPDVDRVATVGLFRAAFRKFDDVEVRVIEREPVGPLDPPDGVTVSVYGPDRAAEAVDGVDVLFVTGSSLIYGGTAAYLRAAAAVPTVVLIGATASFLPGPAFEAGVDVVAGARVTDPDRVRDGVEAGRCGTDLHGAGLEKVYVPADGDQAGLELGGR